MGDCSEPDCEYPATRDYNGLKVCPYCWKKYKDHEEQMFLELKEAR